MKKTIKQPKKRTWMAKLKAQTMEHRCTKRKRTRQTQRKVWINED